MKLPRFTLRTLFVLIAIFACILSWRQSTLNWIEQRKKFLTFPYPVNMSEAVAAGNSAWTAEWDHESHGMPWSLWVWGETLCVRRFRIIHVAPFNVRSTTEKMKRLFPEAKIVLEQRILGNQSCSGEVFVDNLLRNHSRFGKQVSID